MPGIRRMPARNSTTRPAYTAVMLDGRKVSMPIRRWGAAKVGPVSRAQAMIAARAELLAFQARHEGALGVDLSGMVRAFDDVVEAAADTDRPERLRAALASSGKAEDVLPRR